jgi:glycosyltransferase involved in cell wall biosynthesis
MAFARRPNPPALTRRPSPLPYRDFQMRILMLAPQPFFRTRGTPVSVLQRIEGLLQLGHTVDLVTYPMGRTVYREGLTVHRVRRIPMVRDVPIGPSIRKLFFCIPLMEAAVRLLSRERFDMLHTHEEAGILGAWLSRRFAVPHLYDMHSSLPEQFGNFGRFDWPGVRSVFRALEQYALDRADLLITVCPALDAHVGALGYARPRAMIENTFNPGYGVPDPEDVASLRRELRLLGRRVIVYTGTLESYQGLELLLAAVPTVRAAVPDAHVLIVGGTRDQADRLRQAALQMGVADQMTIRPAVDRSEIATYHRLASVLITCRSRGTNTPLKLYEYLRSGRPIVATAIESHLQVFDDRCAHLVAATAPAVADGLIRVLQDGEYGARLAESALAHSEERYSDARYLQLLAGLLDHAVPCQVSDSTAERESARVRTFAVIDDAAIAAIEGVTAPVEPTSVRL